MSRTFRSLSSRAQEINDRWAFNRRLKKCVCGEQKKPHMVVGPKCWSALPAELRSAWKQTIAIEAKREIAKKMLEFTRRNLESRTPKCCLTKDCATQSLQAPSQDGMAGQPGSGGQSSASRDSLQS